MSETHATFECGKRVEEHFTGYVIIFYPWLA